MDHTMPAENTLIVKTTRLDSRVLRVAGLLLASLVAGVLTPPAAAQVEPIEAKWMVVTRTTPMRCGDDPTFYKVADLKRGMLVRMDAGNMRFGRIVYPAGQFAFVPKNDAVLISETELRLVSETAKIRSPNAISGLAGSWRKLYSGGVKTDAPLKILGPVETATGQVTGYRIVPPHPPIVDHPPYGYVELAAMRDATPEEIKAHLETLKPGAETSDETSPDTPTEEVEAPPPPDDDTSSLTGPAADPSHAEENDATQEGGEAAIDLIEDMVLPGEDPEVDGGGDPTDPSADDPADSVPDQGAGAGDAEEAPAESTEPPPPPRDWLMWAELEAELNRARASGREKLEDSLEELIAEYERSLDHAETEPMRHALTQRLEWLRLRKAARDQRIVLDATLDQAVELRARASQRVDTWHTGRYDIVGRLVPSAIYDGRRLPRMFRVRAAGDTGLVRTIGYVRDAPPLDLESMVGSVVGVVGQSRLDNALHLRVITPVRIDTLQARPAPAAAPEG